MDKDCEKIIIENFFVKSVQEKVHLQDLFY